MEKEVASVEANDGPLTLKNLLKTQTGVSFFKDFLRSR